MVWTVDHIIFFAFLILNIILGLKSSKNITSITQYAIGDRNFSTGAIVATIVATWIGGGFFIENIIENYTNGLYYFFTSIAQVLSFFIIGYFFIPRMKEFLGKLSIAEAMGEIYQNKVRLIVSVCGFIGVSGIIAIQFKVAGLVFEYLLNISKFQGIFLIGAVVILYSTMGGIKTVTFTDMMQIFTFGTTIPLVIYYLSSNVFYSHDLVFFTIINHPEFDLSRIFDKDNIKSWTYLFLFFYCLIPAFDISIFQRIAISSNISQAQKSFYISGVIILIITLFMTFLAILLITKNPSLNSNDMINTLLFDNTPPFLKVLLIIGITAIIMSTADSYLNSSAVIFVHDFLKSLNVKINNELLTARLVSIIIAILAIILSFKETSIFRLALFTAGFYMPIVTVPFIMAIFGYRTPYEKAVLYGMGAGLAVVLLWSYLDITVIDNIVPAMAANWLVLVVMHKYYYSKKKSI